MTYHQITSQERYTIAALWQEGLNFSSARHAFSTSNRGNNASEAGDGDSNLGDRVERVYPGYQCLRRLTDRR